MEGTVCHVPQKTVVRHHAVRVVKDLKSVRPESSTGKDEIWIHWRPGSGQPAEVYTSILHVEEAIDRNDLSV